jgi:DeoR/GlpR family transcriptional regulator of sugar metabolism
MVKQSLCRALPNSLTATVITHSPTIAVELMSLVHIKVLLIGGQIYRHSVVATGAIAAEQIAGITADASSPNCGKPGSTSSPPTGAEP